MVLSNGNLLVINYVLNNISVYYWINLIMQLTLKQIARTYSIIEATLKSSFRGNKEDFDDLLQLTMLRILKQKQDFEDIKDYNKWCYQATEWEINDFVKIKNNKERLDFNYFDINGKAYMLNTSSNLQKELLNIKEIYKISDYEIFDDGTFSLAKGIKSFNANSLSNVELKVQHSKRIIKKLPQIDNLESVLEINNRLKEAGLSQGIDYQFVLEGKSGKVKIKSLLRWDGTSLTSYNESQVDLLAEKLITNTKSYIKKIDFDAPLVDEDGNDQDNASYDMVETKNLFGEAEIKTSDRIQKLECLEKLEPTRRKILKYNINGFTQKEISEKIQMIQGTVGDYLAQAKSQMLDCMKGLDGKQ